MAIDLCNSPDDQSSLGIMSPARISFSHDISQTDCVPIEQHIRTTSSSSSIDFDFCVFRESFNDLESSSADELFFDGKILPVEIKRRIINYIPPEKTEQQRPPPPPPPQPQVVLESSSDDPKQSNPKSFWRFKRSSSLNCGSGYARTLCPLPLLSRSNSTGSTPSVKRSTNNNSSKDTNLGHHQKHSQRHNNGGHNYQKPPLKKVYSNGVRINTVLNVPPANLFGFTSLFSGGREKNKKK